VTGTSEVREIDVHERLIAHPAVRNAAVHILEGRQIAFVQNSAKVSMTTLRSWLSDERMNPDEIYFVKSIPDNGANVESLATVRRDKLRARADYVAPRTETEKYLCGLLEDSLDVDRIGVHDDFFRLGGHSMLAVHIRRAIARDKGILLGAEEIFVNGRLADLADRVDEAVTR